MKRKSFLENVVIITGASSGIGKHLSLLFADHGAWLVLADCDIKHLEEVTDLCNQRNGKAIGIPTDVSEKSQCQNLIEKTIEKYGRIDTLINNAGIVLKSRFDALKDLAPFEKVIQVNFFGSVYCTHYALPYLKETKGRLVAICSLRGLFPSATADGYGASKYAMTEFFSSLRIELAESGVSVTIIYPNLVSTDIRRRAIREDGKPINQFSIHEKGAMDVVTCTEQIFYAVLKRERDIVMTLVGKLKLWLRLISPKINDSLTWKASKLK